MAAVEVKLMQGADGIFSGQNAFAAGMRGHEMNLHLSC